MSGRGDDGSQLSSMTDLLKNPKLLCDDFRRTTRHAAVAGRCALGPVAEVSDRSER